LEAAGDDSRDGEVFVQFFPAEGEAVEFDLHSTELVVGRLAEDAISVCRETEDAAVGQFQIDRSSLRLRPDGSGLVLGWVYVQPQVYMKSRKIAHQWMRQDFIPVTGGEHAAEQFDRAAFLYHAMDKRSVRLQILNQILKYAAQFDGLLHIKLMTPARELILPG
jgi:hypothetical protein